MLARMTGFRRWVPLIDLDQSSSVPFGFIFQLANKLTPSDITDCLGKLGIFDHVLDSQAFNAHHLVFVDDACAELVLVISPSIGDTSMDFGNFETRFVAVLRTLLFLGVPSLSFSKSFLILGKEARVTDALTSREGNHRFDAEIKTNHCVDYWFVLNVLFYQDRNKVAVRTILGNGD